MARSKSAMSKSYTVPTLVMNIKREYFAAILSVPRRKHVEYRGDTTYWRNRSEANTIDLKRVAESPTSRVPRPDALDTV
jgi:hypothetical protein